MLKVTYTESGLYLERISESLEEWIVRRAVFALRIKERFVLEPSYASILIASDLKELTNLEQIIRLNEASLTIAVCDAHYVEVGLQGIWLMTGANEAEGVFVTVLQPHTEQLIVQLWQLSQPVASPIWR